MAQVSGGNWGSNLSSTAQLIERCPIVEIKVGDVAIACLLDTRVHGEHYCQLQPSLQSCTWLQQKAANGLHILYLGFGCMHSVEGFGQSTVLS